MPNFRAKYEFMSASFQKLLVGVLFSLLSFWGYSQTIRITPKDSLRMVSLPEMRMTHSYQQSKTSLPQSVDNSVHPYWRNIFWQAGCSCGQASSEGYVYTYEINRKRDLDATLDANRYAYSFTYNFLNIGNTVCGASFIESHDIIREAGIPNLPTNNGVMTDGPMKKWLTGYDKYYQSMHNRINNVYAIHAGTPEGLDVLKHWLYDHLEGSPYGGMAFFYANHVYEPAVIPEGYPEAGKHIITGFSNTSHAMSIVGYNDEVQYDYNGDGICTNHLDITNDGIVDMRDWEIGAFKIANSFNGNNSPIIWADQGFCYVMYRLLAYHNGPGIWDKAAYVSDVKESYEPLLTAKVNMTYNKRDRIKISAGVSRNLSSNVPEFVEDFPHFRYQGDSLHMQGGTSEADKTIEFGLDISELLNHIQPGQPAKWFLIIEEKDAIGTATGQVTNFSVIDYTGLVEETMSSQHNVPIVNNGTTQLTLNTGVDYSPIQIITDSLPHGIINQAYSAQMDASGGTEPHRFYPHHHFKITQIPHTFQPITGTVLSTGSLNAPIPFEFPFYGKKYQVGSVSKMGAMYFEFEDSNVPYDRDYSVLMRYFKTISPFYGYHSTATIRYEGNAESAKYYWNSTFSGTVLKYMVTLFPDGTIYIDYGDAPTPTDYEWQAGITSGDQHSYQEFEFSSEYFPANTRFILEPKPFPMGLEMDENGTISGMITEEFPGDSIYVKVYDNNWLTDIKGYLFVKREILTNNYHVNTPNNTIPEYGEVAQMSFDLQNTGEASCQNILVELIDIDTNYILIDSIENLESLLQGQSISLIDAFEFEINELIPDQTPIAFVVHITADAYEKYDTCFFTVRAPKIDVLATLFTDGDDDILDPGDSGQLEITFQNMGGSTATNLAALLSSSDEFLTINSVSGNTNSSLSPSETWSVLLQISAAANTINGYISTILASVNGDKSFHSNHQIPVGIGLLIEDWETGNTDSYPWQSVGDSSWVIDNTTVYEGNYSLRSGLIEANQTSTLQLAGDVVIPGNISFYKKVSSEANSDFLKFFIDGQEMGSWSGNLTWENHIFLVSSGYHEFKWVYAKNQNTDWGHDAAWIDNIVLPAMDFTPPVLSVSPLYVEEILAPNSFASEPITVTNLGGGMLSFTTRIDQSTIDAIPNGSEKQTRNITNSTITPNPDFVHIGTPYALGLSVYNGSIDSEWIKHISISFPPEIRVDSATSFVGGSGGQMLWNGDTGYGSNAQWHGQDLSSRGFLRNGETAYATLYLWINEDVVNAISLPYELTGDGFGADPHVINNEITLLNQGLNNTWLTLSDSTGNLLSNQSRHLWLHFNSYHIPSGTYNCLVSIESPTDSTAVEVVLTVTSATATTDLTNELSVFPNPANRFIQINCSSELEMDLEVINEWGAAVHHQKIRNNQQISVSSWPGGVYTLIVKGENFYKVQKITVVK